MVMGFGYHGSDIWHGGSCNMRYPLVCTLFGVRLVCEQSNVCRI